MIRVVLAAAALAWLATPLLSADEPTAVEARRARARKAGEEIRATHFFHGGRGVLALPVVADVYDPSRRSPFDRILRHRLGFAYEDCRPIGLHVVRHCGEDVAVAGCAACHAGRAAGRTIVGLGNKNIDVAAIGEQMLELRAVSRLQTRVSGSVDRRIERRALRFARTAADRRYTNPTQGLVSDFVVWHWFYDVSNAPLEPRHHVVKVPHLWGLPQKHEVGFFVDGLGRGLGWMAMQEVTAGQTPDAVRAYLPRLRAFLRQTGDLLPPRYPFAIDAERAQRGRALFETHCAACHGTHERDAHGFPVFEPPSRVALEEVGTDPDRYHLPPRLMSLIAASPLADQLAFEPDRLGYLAPRLDGIWSRFPYLHNASVPTLRALLTPPDERPVAWSLRDAGERRRFDTGDVGLTMPRRGTRAGARLLRDAKRGARHVYFTRRPGHSNQGHAFGTELSAPDKRALIEYLKTL